MKTSPGQPTIPPRHSPGMPTRAVRGTREWGAPRNGGDGTANFLHMCPVCPVYPPGAGQRGPPHVSGLSGLPPGSRGSGAPSTCVRFVRFTPWPPAFHGTDRCKRGDPHSVSQRTRGRTIRPPGARVAARNALCLWSRARPRGRSRPWRHFQNRLSRSRSARAQLRRNFLAALQQIPLGPLLQTSPVDPHRPGGYRPRRSRAGGG